QKSHSNNRKSPPEARMRNDSEKSEQNSGGGLTARPTCAPSHAPRHESQQCDHLWRFGAQPPKRQSRAGGCVVCLLRGGIAEIEIGAERLACEDELELDRIATFATTRNNLAGN